MASGDTRTQQYLGIAANGNRADLPGETCCETRTQTLTREVAERVIGLDEEIQELKNNPDVVDIVETYQDLEDYDTSTLTDKDIIRVLQDSTHSGNSTYYRWNVATNQFDFVGEISGGSSVNVVQTIGTSTTDVMSQDATTKLVFDTNNTNYENIKIGESPSTSGVHSIGIGKYSAPTGPNSVAIGSAGSASYRAASVGNGSVAVGFHSVADGENSIALGSYSLANGKGVFAVGASTSIQGYNNSQYRLLTGLYDGQGAHDAVTVEQVNATIDAINAALSTSIPHIGA